MISLVLIGIEHPGNLGAIARVMKNFGFSDLRLITPKCSPTDEQAKTRAKHAQDILQNAKTITLDDLKQFDLIIGTSAITGSDYNLPRTPLLPTKLKEKLETKKGNIALVFGKESDGLTNEEIAHCDFLVTIPTNNDYAALNLSHAVAIILYELAKDNNNQEQFPLVKAKEKEQLQLMITQILDNMQFQTKEKRQTQELLWKRLITKSMLTQREAMALMGFLKKI